MPIFPGNSNTPLAKLEWFCMDEPAWILDDYSLKPTTPPTHHGVDADEIDYHDYALAVSGDVFRWMINNAPLETLQRVSPDVCVQPILTALHRCWSKLKYLHECLQMKRMRSSNGYKRLAIPF